MRSILVAYEDLTGLFASHRGYFQRAGNGAFRIWVVGDDALLCAIATGSDAESFEGGLIDQCAEVRDEDHAKLLGLLANARALSAPRTSDGKTIVLPSLFPGGVFYHVTGAGDGVSTRGDGEPCAIQVAGTDPSDPAPLDVDWMDSVYLEGGIIMWSNAAFGDHVTMELILPATVATPAPDGDGNVNRVALGGGAFLFVPAASNGTHVVDLDAATPVPAFNEETGASSGYWDWSDPPTGRGTIVPSETAGTGRWNLLSVQPSPVRFINRFHLLGNGSVDLKPPIKPKKLLPHWLLRTRVHSAGRASGALELVWSYKTGRAATS